MSKLRWGSRFSGTGLGHTPTAHEIYGLLRVPTRRFQGFQARREALKERALQGDGWAIDALKKVTLAHRGAASATTRSKTRPVTKIKFSWDKEE